jgi:hypothetical protein
MLRIPTSVNKNFPRNWRKDGFYQAKRTCHLQIQQIFIARGLAHYRVGPSLIRGRACVRVHSNAQEAECTRLSDLATT